MRQRLRLALQLLARDWRAGELRLLAASLVIAVGAVTAVGFFADRLQRGMLNQSADLLGADTVLVSPEPVEAAWMAEAGRRGLRQARALEFTSVVLRGERLQLSSIRAVSRGYPLRGTLKTAPAPFEPEVVTAELPAPGTVWAEARLLQALGAAIGDRVEIGNAELTIARILGSEPGRGGSFFSLAPRVLMSEADIVRTGVIQPGSRVTYGYGLAGGDAEVAAYRQWLVARLSANQRLLDPHEGNPTLGRALERVERYLGLTSLIAVLLAGVAIAMGARRYSRRHYDVSAMLRCLGASQRDILLLYLLQLLALGLAASAAGCLLGWLGQAGLHALLKGLFPAGLPAPGAGPAALGLLTGLLTLTGFAAAPVLRLKQVPPLRVLRRELSPLPASAFAVYGLALGAMLILMWRYTGSASLTAIVLAGSTAAALLLAGLAFGLLGLGRLLRARGGVAWRFGVNNLWRRPRASVVQILAFGFALMAMALMTLVRTDLLSTWQRQLPEHTPNHFAFNILPADVGRVQQFFAGHAIEAQAIYPMVRGRLTEINGVPVTQAVTKEENNIEAIHRELNLSWSATLPPDNEVVQGAWWPSDARAPLVSVEARLAQRLGIAVGDRLTYSIGGAPLSARVEGLRKVQWDSFHPNFYMLFPPGVLDDFPATYLTSFYLTPAQKPLLIPLVRAFPAVTVFETDQLLAQVRAILRQVTAAVELVLLFVLAAGLAVLYAALAASHDERLHEGALLRVLGASRARLRTGQLVEFAALGVLAGLLAATGTELIAGLLYTRVFDLGYRWQWTVWVAAPLAGGLLIAAAGMLGTRRVVRASPMAVLREL